MSWLDIFKKDKEILKKNNNRIYYNQEEIIMERVNNKDKIYLVDMRNFIENIIKESYFIDKDSKADLVELINLIENEELKYKLHNIRKRANQVAHELEYKIENKYINGDLYCIDELIDYLKNKNSNLSNYEFFSMSRRIVQEPLIEKNKMYSNKKDLIDFEKIEEIFEEKKNENKEYYISSYNAKEFCMTLSFDKYYSKELSKECPPIFYVVHNILIRKDMVRKSKYLSGLELNNAELDEIRKYEIIILHAMKYGAIYFNNENEISVPKNEIKYATIAYQNIMYYANILNKMQKNKLKINNEIMVESNIDPNSKKIIVNGKFEIKYELLEFIPKGVTSTMWFTQKIDYEIKDDNKYYYEEILNDLFGHKMFRPGQLDVIKNILENNIKNIPLAVFPTGYGKSLIYQYCAILEPQKTIVICPTEILACDQVFNLNEDGLNIGKIISCYEKNLNDRNSNLIYYAIPDVFLNYELNKKLSNEDSKDQIYNIVLDECHNISLWGHQFDPTYFSLSKNIITNFKNCNVTMFTATASKLVINDIKNQFLNCEIEVFQPVPLDRGYINYQIKKINNIEEIIKDLSNQFNKNYGKGNNWDLNERTSSGLCKTLIINNDNEILNKLYNGLQKNDFIVPYISKFNDSLGTYKSFRNGSKKILLSNDDFVVGINIPELVNLVCIGVPPSKEWLYQESGRVGRNLEYSNVIIYIPNKPSELFNKMIDTTFDIKNITSNRELQSQLNIDVSNINYFNSYFQDKEEQLKEYEVFEQGTKESIYVVGESNVGIIEIKFEKKHKEACNYLLYMLCLIDFIKSWQTKVSNDNNFINYLMTVRSSVDLQEMISYLNRVINESTSNITVRGKYLRKNNLATTPKELLSNLLDWYYETIISIKREMLINTYDLLLNSEITSEEIERNLAIYFEISQQINDIKIKKEVDVYNDEDSDKKFLEIKRTIEESTKAEEEFFAEDDDESYLDFENDIEDDFNEKNVLQEETEKDSEINHQVQESNVDKKITDDKESKKTKTEILIDILSTMYDDKNIDFNFFEIYMQLNDYEKYNLQFLLEREIETGYIYGYELVMALLELENKGSKLIRFSKLVKITSKQLLELLINKLDNKIDKSNKRKAYKIIYKIYTPTNMKEWFKKIF